MKLLLLTIFLLPVAFHQAQGQKVLLNENFQSYANGSDGSPVWHPVKGSWHIQEGGYNQIVTDYDCASMLSFYLDKSFGLEAEFEHLEGDIGVGFIFASRQYDNISFAQMVRYDGGTTFLMGYFQDGEFNATSSVKAAAITVGTRHTLSLNVNRDTNTFTVFIDGQNITPNDVTLTYPGGYIGLQSSAGKVRFHKVTLTELKTEGIQRSIDWIERFSILPNGNILIPDSRSGIVRIVSQSGTTKSTIGTPAKDKGQLVEPNSVALLDSASVIVTDRGTNKLHLFSLSGAWVKSIGWKGSARGQFDEPCAIALNSVHQIFIVDRNNNRLQVFDRSLTPITDFGGTLLKKPADIAIDGDRVFVLNSGLCQIEIYQWTGEKAIWQFSIPYGGAKARGLAVRNNILYLSLVNQVRAYDLTGNLLHTFIGRSIDFIFPQGISFHHDTLFIADYFAGRIIKTTPELLDPDPEIKSVDSSSATVRWQTIDPSLQNTLSFKNLASKKTHYYKIPNILETIPRRREESRQYSFTTTAGSRTKLYTRIKMATLLFTHILDDSAAMARHGEPVPVDPAEVERIREQINDGIRFYWIHSGMNFLIDMDFIVINDKLWRNEIYGSEWWYPPKEDVLDKYLKLKGKEKSSYSGFLYLSCTQSYDSTRNGYTLSGKGGGFTSGVGTGKGYGISWWDVTKKHHNAGNNWLMVHEFNHQLDDIFMVSGYREYWFNHISPTIGTAADFGEHFDANAHILRMVPATHWFDLRYTDIATARDFDLDGIPDHEVSLPLDESRFGSDSTLSDSDTDGVSDLDELQSSNWLTEGWGETFGGRPIFPNLSNKDTDFDGIQDNTDPYPCYPETPRILFRTGQSLTDENRIGSLIDDRVSVTSYASWNANELSFSFKMDNPVPIKFMLDADADGWFLGRGNYLINLKPTSDTGYSATIQIFNASLPDVWPFMDKSIADTLKVSTVTRRQDRTTILTVIIPKNDFLGLLLTATEKVGISLGFYCPVDDAGSQRYITMFEPNRFFDMLLVK